MPGKSSVLALALVLFASSASAQAPPRPEGLFPFVLPWDDASGGVTSSSTMLDRPAGARGFVTARDGHLYAGDKRIRFFGVNVCFSADCPTHGDAERIAARMAKFGINCVRFHHTDTLAAPGGLLQKDRLTLDPEQMDKLDYFIAELKKNGIYSDLNLHVGRNYPNVPEWKDAPRAGKGLDNFSPEMIKLQRDYARDLLTHVNAYTHARYADEPAVAFIEINNEVGLLNSWFRGSLDGMPEPYASALSRPWNEWLKAKYATDAALKAAWSKGEEPLGAEMLKNGDFAAGLAGWAVQAMKPAAATSEKSADAPGGKPSLKVRVSKRSDTSWHVQVHQGALKIEPGRTYTLRLLARADAGRTLGVNVMQDHAPWKQFGNLFSKAAGDWRPIVLTFSTAEGDDNARVTISGLASETGTYEFADVSLKPGGIVGLDPAEALGRVAIVTKGELRRRTEPAQRDWLTFLRGLESDYWTGISRFIKEELKSKSLVIGTASEYSTPGLQAELDVVDAHAYWQHPYFPGRQWDPNNWTVTDVSMANSPGGVLTGLAARRVEGKPFVVTEYNHQAPNTFSSEAPLLLAAFAGYQDWDGVFLFTYSQRRDDWDARKIESYFDIDQHPVKMANVAVASAMFERGDIRPGREAVSAALTPGREVDLLRSTGGTWKVYLASLGVPEWTSLVHRVALRLGGPDAPAAPAADEKPPSAFASDTNELAWDLSRKDKGVVTVNAPRAKCVVGFVDGRSFSLGGVTIAPGKTVQDWCTVALELREGESFSGPARALLVATGFAENTGMDWKTPERNTVGRDWGKAPSRVEGIPATITLPVAAARVKAWALDEKGQRSAELPVKDSAGKAELFIGPEYKTLWYEVEILR